MHPVFVEAKNIMSPKLVVNFLFLISANIILMQSFASDNSLPKRKDIFEKISIGRPAINQTGNLIAISGIKSTKTISLLDLTSGKINDVIDIDGLSNIYWYRWLRRNNYTLIISAKINQSDVIFEFDIEAKKITLLSPSESEQGSSFSTYKNNYAFTYNRYWDKSRSQLSEIDKDGSIYLVKYRKNLHNASKQEEGFINATFQSGEILWTFGLAQYNESKLKINSLDQRQGTGLISISAEKNKAYFLSSVDMDTVSLIEIDLRNGDQRLISQVDTDIRKVIVNPETAVPEFIEYENFKPALKALEKNLESDVTFLTSQGFGVPSIIDRSPNDLYWIVRYEHMFPAFYVYDRKNREIKSMMNFDTNNAKYSEWLIESYNISRTGEPNISGYISLPGKKFCRSVKCPAVLMLHGGPGERDFSSFNSERFWLNSRGIIVINVNYRGSSGFGKKFEKLDRLEWDRGIPKDVIDSLDYLLKKYPIDNNRIAIVGTSFSGYLSLNLMSSTEKFKCGIVDSAITDLVKFSEARYASYAENSDLLYRIGDPRVPDERVRLFDMSPLSKMAKLKNAKILQFHGDKDTLISPEINFDFSQKLIKENRNFTFVKLPNTSHGLLESRKQYHAISELFLADCLNIPAENLDATDKDMIDRLEISGRKSFLSKKY